MDDAQKTGLIDFLTVAVLDGPSPPVTYEQAHRIAERVYRVLTSTLSPSATPSTASTASGSSESPRPRSPDAP